MSEIEMHPEPQAAPASADAAPASDATTVQPPLAAEGPITEDQVRATLRKVKDPELNLNIIDLGLVYAINIDGAKVSIDMSLTSPGCPSGPEIMTAAEEQLKLMPGVSETAVNLVWSPLWSPDRIEPRIRTYLGF